MRKPFRGTVFLSGLPARALALLIVIVCSMPVLTAQTVTDSTYRFYRATDSVFRLVGTNLAHMDVARAFRLDYVRGYNPFSAADLSRMMNNPGDSLEAVRGRFYRQAFDSGIRIINPVTNAEIDLKNTRILENYAKVDSIYFHNLYIARVNTWGLFDTVMYGAAFGITVPTSSGGDTLVAGGPTYNATWAFHRADPSLFSRAGLPDRSTYFRIGVTVKADTGSTGFKFLNLDDQIAKVLLYRRVRASQNDCRCAAYQPFDSIIVTKRYYLDSTVAADSSGYREISKLINMAYDTIIYKSDSTVWRRNWNNTADSIQIFHADLYNRETVVGKVLSNFTTLDVTSLGSPAYHIIRTNDSIQLTHVPLHRLNNEPALHGDGLDWFGYANCSPDSCEARRARGDFGPGAILEKVELSDFNLHFYSTQRVPITFLRSRINQDLYDKLRAGALDSLMRTGVRDLIANDTLHALIGRLPYSDETTFHKFRSDGVHARHIQDILRQEGDSTLQLWCNPPSNFAAVRVLTEDLDTTRVKTLQLIVRQDYKQTGAFDDGLPIYYVNPDSMSAFGSDSTYRVVGRKMDNSADSVYRMILGHSMTDYHYYDSVRQAKLGKFLESKTDLACQDGPLMRTLPRLIDVARFRYRQFGPSTLVWNTIQDYGLRSNNDPVPPKLAGYYQPWGFRPQTPEEITVQAWLSLNCGVDGLVYTDLQYDGLNFGPIHNLLGTPTKDYDSLFPPNITWPTTYADSLPYRQPKIWTGFLARYNAIRAMNDEIRLLDSLVHLTQLVFSQEQMSLHDEGQHFADFPLLDTVITERAKRRLDTAGRFVADTTFDPRAETYMDISHFGAGPGNDPASHYIIFTNRRCWPVDTIHYDTAARNRGADSIGLGAIDVRRPIIRLKAQSEALIDSFLVEKVGHELEWPSRRVGIDSLLTLDWIAPGWGAMYRIVPIYSGIGEHGTAWNNAVHAENPSSDIVQRDRVLVYQRDSVVYLTTIDSNGAKSSEWMLSDTTDTVRISSPYGGTRVLGANYLPAFASLRGDSAMRGGSPNALGCVVVWEHRDSADNVSVEMLYLDTLPSRARGLVSDTFRIRLQLAPPRPLLRSWMNLAPAIVAVEDKGFVVAWGSPDGDGIEVKVVQTTPAPLGALVTVDTSTTMHAKMLAPFPGAWPTDTIAQYPALAYCRNLTKIITNDGTFSEIAAPEDDDDPEELPLPGTGDSSDLRLVYLAYQQGSRDNTNWEIMHHVLGVDFRPINPPVLWLSRAEHVSNNIAACYHTHPSIAVDSSLVGVAWEANYGTRSIVLRFRDTLRPVESNRWRWKEPFYRWSDFNMIRRNVVPGLLLRRYTHPSLTQFPGLRENQLVGIPEGAIVWQWINDRDLSRRNRVVLYRYGEMGIDTSLRDGMDPTMMLAPNLSASRSAAFQTGGIFHRGRNTEQFIADRLGGDQGFYYPGYLINSPAVPNRAFMQPLAARDTIIAIYEVGPEDRNISNCVAKGIRGGLVLQPFSPPVTRRSDSTPIVPPAPPWNEWGMPPTFFPTKPDGPRSVTTLVEAAGISRTGNFRAGDSVVRIRRILIGDDSLVAWLDTQPYDTAAGRPANIRMMVQVVRASDGAILWAGDTISARGLGNDTIDAVLNVPMYPYVPRDTVVYIRLYSMASPYLACAVTAGFEFVEGVIDTGGSSSYKRLVPPGMRGVKEEIDVAIVPNPLRAGTGDLHVVVEEEGVAAVVIYDLLGNPVHSLPDLVADRIGEYVVPIDLSDLHEGTYIIEVRMRGGRGTRQFVVMR